MSAFTKLLERVGKKKLLEDKRREPLAVDNNSLDLLNPLNPISPISPMNPINWPDSTPSHDYTPSSDCGSSSYDSGSSFDSGGSCGGDSGGSW